MDRTTAIFVDGIGTAAGNSGVLSPLQGRIFALLYLQESALSLDGIAAELQQSKSNISINIRGLIDWHLVRRVVVAGSRKDHYEAATNFWRVMQEIMERRFRWAVRQVLAAASDLEAALASGDRRRDTVFVKSRVEGLRAFFAAVDAGIAAFTQGRPVDPESMKNVLPMIAPRAHRRS